MKMLIVSFLFLTLVCEHVNSQNYNNIDISLLLREWTNSYEEETDSVKIYRSSDSMEFLPSRYRERIKFIEPNVYKYLVLSPNDAHYFRTAKWEYDKNTNQIIITDEELNNQRKFKILVLTKTLLKIEYHK